VEVAALEESIAAVVQDIKHVSLCVELGKILVRAV
jgi:hypothetical protein